MLSCRPLPAQLPARPLKPGRATSLLGSKPSRDFHRRQSRALSRQRAARPARSASQRAPSDLLSCFPPRSPPARPPRSPPGASLELPPQPAALCLSFLCSDLQEALPRGSPLSPTQTPVLACFLFLTASHTHLPHTVALFYFIVFVVCLLPLPFTPESPLPQTEPGAQSFHK